MKNSGIYFTDNHCIACGYRGSINSLDYFGRPINSKSKDIRYYMCSKCGTEYIPVWDLESNTNIFKYKEVAIRQFLDDMGIDDK